MLLAVATGLSRLRTSRTKTAAVTPPLAVARKTRPAAEGGNHAANAEMSGDRAGGALLGQRIGGAVRRRRGRARSANAQTPVRSRRVALERDGRSRDRRADPVTWRAVGAEALRRRRG